MHRHQSITRVAGFAAALALLSSGCTGISPEGRQMIQEPLACANAQEGIRVLEADRAGAGLRVAQGLQGIMPPMIVLSGLRDIFIGEPFRSVYLDHWRIAFGSYNRRIDARLAELQTCE